MYIFPIHIWHVNLEVEWLSSLTPDHESNTIYFGSHHDTCIHVECERSQTSSDYRVFDRSVR
jgi:hypothetical protein